jgi:hypothetical protein
MNTDDFVAELFREHDWRFDEVRRLKNLLSGDRDPLGRDELRKSLVVVLYAHFEGFCVFALEHYLIAVNQEKIDCRDANPAVLAGAWNGVFGAMESGDQKCRIFSQPLPNDQKLHRHWRRRHFVEEIDRLSRFKVVIPEDVIDTESNLKPEVLQRNLFLLGLDFRFVDPYADIISNLLGRRNRIAHGDDRRGVTELEYDAYESAVFEVCFRLLEFLEESHRQRAYEKSHPGFVV